MRVLRWSTRDLAWLVVAVALLLALAIQDRRHRDELDRVQGRARTTIWELVHELYMKELWKGEIYTFEPETAIPDEYDWTTPSTSRDGRFVIPVPRPKRTGAARVPAGTAPSPPSSAGL